MQESASCQAQERPTRRLTPSPLVPVIRDGGAQRASDRVYATLSAAIRDLSLAPGRSLSETELAESLNVSRTPLREAIARLVDAGLVQVVPQVGTRVALIRLSDVEEARFVRENLEVAAFEVACTDSGAQRHRRCAACSDGRRRRLPTTTWTASSPQTRRCTSRSS